MNPNTGKVGTNPCFHLLADLFRERLTTASALPQLVFKPAFGLRL